MQLQICNAHLEAGPPKTVLYTELADALVKLDRTAEAAVVLRKAIGLDPFNSALQKTLIVRLIELKEYASARTALESYVERFPEDSFMRQMLARAQAAAAEMIEHVGADVLICPVERSSTVVSIRTSPYGLLTVYPEHESSVSLQPDIVVWR